MFIPRGKPIHDNLATTYVLVDALVADLCEGGFSGVVEVVLRDTDAHVLFAEGKVVGVVEQRGLSGKTSELNRRYSRATVPELASRSRYERGRISVYAFSAETALAVAGLSDAEQLYAGLSTDFADLEKMISKLARERDRQWFVELRLLDGAAALIHLKDDRCRIIGSHPETGEYESPSAGLVNNPALLDLLQGSREVGGTFDVYFRGANEDVKPIELAPPEPFAETALSLDAAVHLSGAGSTPQSIHGGDPERAATDITETVAASDADEFDQPLARSSADDPVPPSAHELAEARLEALSRASGGDEDKTGQASAEQVWQPVLSEEPSEEAITASSVESTDVSARDQTTADIPPSISTAGLPRQTTGLSAIRTELQASSDLSEVNEAQIMNEVKRLLGEIARTIDDAARAVEQRDMFSIYLRAGQLKVADRYPFLDPFGAEFEYLAGEIAFVGNAAPWEFIEGLTEALKIAVEGVAQASTQGPKLRAQVAEDLKTLLDANRAEFVEYGLDGTIEEVTGG